MKDEELKELKKEWLYKTILIVIGAICLSTMVATITTYYVLKSKIIGVGLQLDTVSVESEKDEESDDSGKVKDETLDAIASNIKKFTPLINAYYKGEINDEKIINETIKGYINGLDDEYSEYFTPEELENYKMQALGNYYGVGISMIANTDGNIEIAQVFEGSPAAEAGVQVGDIIVEINGENFLGKTPDEAATILKGDEGTTVNVTFARGSEYVNLDVGRREIKIYHVKSKLMEGNVGYIFLYTFDTDCSKELKEAVTSLKEQGATKFIIDLRYNTGGMVDEAVKIAALFLPKGSPVYFMEDSKDNETPVYTDTEPVDTESPILIMTNKYSASASEIFAGALKDHGRAKLVGAKTYGKGVMQNLFSLLDGSALKLTFAEYLTPNKTHINKIGIEPDYAIELQEDGMIDASGEDISRDNQIQKALEVIRDM